MTEKEFTGPTTWGRWHQASELCTDRAGSRSANTAPIRPGFFSSAAGQIGPLRNAVTAGLARVHGGRRA